MTARDGSDTMARELDAHWYAAEGISAALVHAMLVRPARIDVTAAVEAQDWQRAVASAIECLRWIAAASEVLAGRGAARTSVDVDLVLAASGPAGPIDAVRDLVVRPGLTGDDVEPAVRMVDAAEARLVALLPVHLPLQRTPTGYQPAVEVVSQLERLRHRLGLPLFDWEGWIG